MRLAVPLVISSTNLGDCTSDFQSATQRPQLIIIVAIVESSKSPLKIILLVAILLSNLLLTSSIK